MVQSENGESFHIREDKDAAIQIRIIVSAKRLALLETAAPEIVYREQLKKETRSALPSPHVCLSLLYRTSHLFYPLNIHYLRLITSCYAVSLPLPLPLPLPPSLPSSLPTYLLSLLFYYS